MKTNALFNNSVLVTCPPVGSRNVQIGSAIVGPGGRWVPCASATVEGSFMSCVFEVGPGRKQVCLASRPSHCASEALVCAIELATIAAA